MSITFGPRITWEQRANCFPGYDVSHERQEGQSNIGERKLVWVFEIRLCGLRQLLFLRLGSLTRKPEVKIPALLSLPG